MAKHNRFQRRSINSPGGTYKCRGCGKRTRETGDDATMKDSTRKLIQALRHSHAIVSPGMSRDDRRCSLGVTRTGMPSGQTFAIRSSCTGTPKIFSLAFHHL